MISLIKFSLLFYSGLFHQLAYVDGYNVLFFHSFVTSSHRTAIWPLAEKLADLGHNVTYIFPVTKKIGSHPRIRELTPSKMVPLVTEHVSDFDINIRLENRVNEWLQSVFEVSFDLCKAFYESPEIQEWLNDPNVNFDLIFIDGSLGECGYGLVHRFKAKHILFIPLLVPFLQDAFGLVPESSSIPENILHSKPTEMTLFGRMKTTLVPLVWRYKFNEYLTLLEPVIKNGLNLTDMPPLPDIERNASLVMISNHFVEDYPISLPPMFVSFSGLWCSREKLRARKPLPENIEKFVEKSDGFFYISFGSSTVASKMPVEMLNHFFNSFRAFPKHKFLWRWTGPVPNDTPENVMLLPWFPQHDILAHPKLRAFMTQAGRPSTQEALCHGAPLITMPIFADQDYNADRLEYLGATINIDIATVAKDKLIKSFKDIMENSTYRTRMRELSEIFRDRPLDPLDNAIYWTNYVMIHDTSLLKPLAVNQTWYQRRLLDVYVAFLVILLAVLTILLLIVYFSLRFFVMLITAVLRDGEKNKHE